MCTVVSTLEKGAVIMKKFKVDFWSGYVKVFTCTIECEEFGRAIPAAINKYEVEMHEITKITVELI